MIEKWLKGLTYFAVICLCFVRMHSYWDDLHSKAKPSPQYQAAHLVGSRIALNGNTVRGMSRGTVVIAMTTSCVFCRASAPFYRKLLQKARTLPGSVRTLAVMPESKDAAVEYLRDSLVLTFDDVVQHVPGFATQFTPTLLVADEQGVVKGAWIGVPKPAAEDEAIVVLCGIAGVDGARCRTQ